MNPLDLQVNGYTGVDFNSDDLTSESLHAACQALDQDGVSAILATFITDSLAAMTQRVQRLVTLRAADPLAQRIVRGIHLEGPFLSPQPGFCGAHPTAHMLPASPEAIQPLLDAGAGLVRLVTLAPEQDAAGRTTRFLADQGITVSTGHANPSLQQLEAAIDSGLSMVTHLGNACPLDLPRHDNIIQRCLTLSDRLWICMIPDGVHIPFFALKNYLRVVPPERAIFVTDAISAARLGPGQHRLAGREIDIGEDLVARLPNGMLCGSTVTVPRIIELSQQHLGLSDADLTRLLDTNPRLAVPLPAP